ncbi:16S rRNA (guanine(966)-N(2))-methyltransferase RsmD [Demequina globuliformis]|uniref:16S rRNA (guanine(966)-N(2))-methyltransferase RsmD n=1 Tax=Demequina globuliformis TaxID=676202 RepID=UPI0007865588|nr:16S rRNA (guanine(966)-N(2))-methyltransferase RsmD [Demequina globuliformis]
MTRIIAGQYGGRRLAVPQRGTRPTTDRVREALFSRLDHADELRDAEVLDLFAGSGALGLEALSRGARRATLVDSAPAAARVLQANVRDLGLASTVRVVKEKAASFLARATGQFDLVLIDPPYDLPSAEVDAILAALVPVLAPGAAVVLEGSTRAQAPQWPRGIALAASKDYGETRLFYAHAGDPESSEVASGT